MLLSTSKGWQRFRLLPKRLSTCRTSFRSLEWIHFSGSLGCFSLQVSCEVTVSPLPLRGRIGIAAAKLPRREFNDPAAAFTTLDNIMAGSTVKRTTLLAHEDAANSWFNRYTVHGNHPPFFIFFVSEIYPRIQRGTSSNKHFK